jgi:hypothetical protein
MVLDRRRRRGLGHRVQKLRLTLRIGQAFRRRALPKRLRYFLRAKGVRQVRPKDIVKFLLSWRYFPALFRLLWRMVRTFQYLSLIEARSGRL